MNPIEIIDKREVASKQLKKLELDQTSASQINMLMQEIPSILTESALNANQLYVCNAPLDLLDPLRGGFSSMIRGEGGQYAAQASFYPVQANLIAMSVFSTMSIATGQYFLKQINDEFKVINQKVDAIVDFLYGDKKAELMAEISFVQYAYKNFESIMKNNEQRVATLTSLQEARKVALKDIEFYLNDLEKRSLDKKTYGDFERNAELVCRIEETLQMSEQLYALSSMMEIYFAKNREKALNDYIRDDVAYYINKCEKRILAGVTRLADHTEYKSIAMKPIDTTVLDNKLKEISNKLGDGTEPELCKIVKDSINAYTNINKYYINPNGEVFVERA